MPAGMIAIVPTATLASVVGLPMYGLQTLCGVQEAPAWTCLAPLPSGLSAHPGVYPAVEAYPSLPGMRGVVPQVQDAGESFPGTGLGNQGLRGLILQISAERVGLRGLALTVSGETATGIAGLVEHRDEAARPGRLVALASPVTDESAIYPTGQNR
ncbi:hypothetical protein G3N56_06225 [Desulfovibrio sulfodismutans]|uniref:Uncharacterized protein n=1 Tax=Desulfolutivibrio sulfodismutans TaxID=63561 RepID=A0A7K3NMA6_9BACT|nr:hypothetical protein [Desulfolutivibrio sulfodismutans]NDY56339.1 hypothetical protein [Desulfolutivibrio sulfodismutans]QLA14176.1 hypothetical protein GD606_18845 [Desulfolutivibrio sulfodismutans DSM 3696]